MVEEHSNERARFSIDSFKRIVYLPLQAKMANSVSKKQRQKIFFRNKSHHQCLRLPAEKLHRWPAKQIGWIPGWNQYSAAYQNQRCFDSFIWFLSADSLVWFLSLQPVIEKILCSQASDEMFCLFQKR